MERPLLCNPARDCRQIRCLEQIAGAQIESGPPTEPARSLIVSIGGRRQRVCHASGRAPAQRVTVPVVGAFFGRYFFSPEGFELVGVTAPTAAGARAVSSFGPLFT